MTIASTVKGHNIEIGYISENYYVFTLARASEAFYSFFECMKIIYLVTLHIHCPLERADAKYLNK